MKYVYITGDRALSPISAVHVVHHTLLSIFKTHGSDIQVITGNAPSGIEKAVRYLVPKEHITVAKRGLDPAGNIDFDASNKFLAPTVDAVYVLHPDPMNSRVAQSVARNFSPSIVEYPLSEMLSQNITTEGL